MKRLFLIIAALTLCACPHVRAAESPPLTPMWALGLWVWEDDVNTADRARKIVDGYLQRDIPVSVVILDSPWSEEYNDFEFDRDLYPDPQGFIDEMHAKDVRVVLWVTGMINKMTRKSGETEESELYREAVANRYVCNNGALTKWWKGQGAFIDYTSPEAVAWWHGLMDPVMDMGIDGWKVDQSGFYFPDGAACSTGPVHKREYMTMYYTDMFDYTMARNPGAVVFSRSVDLKYQMPRGFAPIDKTNATWVGDQQADWSHDGFQEALEDIFHAARLGYAVVGSDGAAYQPGDTTVDGMIEPRLLIRWMQFSAFNTYFSFGGHNERRIWLYGEEVTRIFRYYVKLHYELIPYLHSLVVKAHRTGAAPITPLPGKWQFLLGPDILVAAMYEDSEARDVMLPPGDEWIDYWTDREWPGRTKIEAWDTPLERYPIFIRRGAVIPMNVVDNTTGHGGAWSRGALTLDIYPEEGMVNEFSLFDEAMNESVVLVREKSDLLTVNVTDMAKPLVLRIRNQYHPLGVTVNGEEAPRIDEQAAFADLPLAWRLADNRLWVKTPVHGDVQVECRFVK